MTVTVGVGHGTGKLEQIGESYQAAVDALGYKAIVGTGGPIFITDMEPVNRGRLQLGQKDEVLLETQIKFGSPETIGQTIREMVGRMEDTRVHASQYQVYMLSLVNCITRMMQQYDMDLRSIFDEHTGFAKWVEDDRKREEFTRWLIELACRMNEVIGRRRDNTARAVIEEAKKYIKENYRNPDLSVEMICRQLQMSPAYFSTIFRKETGKTCVAYLTDVRLEQAVELLKATRLM